MTIGSTVPTGVLPPKIPQNRSFREAQQRLKRTLALFLESANFGALSAIDSRGFALRARAVQPRKPSF